MAERPSRICLLRERFLARVRRTPCCWLWTGDRSTAPCTCLRCGEPLTLSPARAEQHLCGVCMVVATLDHRLGPSWDLPTCARCCRPVAADAALRNGDAICADCAAYSSPEMARCLVAPQHEQDARALLRWVLPFGVLVALVVVLGVVLRGCA